ncbi:hypothetical protein [Variovorax sp. WS11]|uniref:type I restriction endonuclease subunit R, EcoR124 family n=1 Tax=Variovorax sp. WS11 TaxID=1105204 RepID=UPI001EF19ECF|nr:hypothetical protein [Variovorax sp. WS11]
MQPIRDRFATDRTGSADPEVDLLKSQEINLDYILELIFENNRKIKDKAALVEDVRRVIRASLGNRAKESLLVDFINQTDLDQMGDKASVIDAFFAFAQAELQREAQELINAVPGVNYFERRIDSSDLLPELTCCLT